MGDQQQRAGVGHEGLGEVFAGVDVQMVGGLVQKQQVGPFQHDLRKAQAGQLATGKRLAGLEHRLAPEAQLCQMAAHLQLGHAGVLVPDHIDDPALPQTVLLLGKDAGPCAGAQPHHAAGGAALAVQHLHQGGLARAVGACDHQPLAAAHRVGKGFQQGALPYFDGQVLEQHQLVPRFYVIFKPELELVGLVLWRFGDLQLFQLLAAALGHFGGGGAHKVAVHVVLQLFGQCHICIVLLLAQGIGGFLLGQVGREVALVGGHGLEGDLPDLRTHVIEEVAVVADHQHRTGIAFEVVFQPFHGGKVQVVGGLVQNEHVRLFQQQLCQPQPRQLAAGEHRNVLLPCILRKAHAGQHLFDVHIHVVAVGGIHDVLQLVVPGQQLRVVRLRGHFAFQHLHLGHGIQHRGKGGAHLAVEIQRGIQLCVLFQIAQRHAVGHAELTFVVLVLAGQNLEQGGLARAVLAHDADAVLPLDTGGHIVQHDLFAKALA